jgi:hypothetical protein
MHGRTSEIAYNANVQPARLMRVRDVYDPQACQHDANATSSCSVRLHQVQTPLCLFPGPNKA